MSALDLDVLEALVHAATSGPWGEKPDDLPSLYSEAADTWGLSSDGTDLQLFIADEASAADVAFIRAARQNVPSLIVRIRELEARVARVRAVHWPFTVYDDCGHDHKPEDAGVIDVDDIGLVCGYGKVYDICASCCADDGESQSENCLGHEHGPGHPICATIAALDEVSA